MARTHNIIMGLETRSTSGGSIFHRVEQGQRNALREYQRLHDDPEELHEFTVEQARQIAHIPLKMMQPFMNFETEDDVKNMVTDRYRGIFQASEVASLTFDTIPAFISEATELLVDIQDALKHNEPFNDLEGKPLTVERVRECIAQMRLAFWVIAVKQRYKTRGADEARNSGTMDRSQIGFVKELVMSSVLIHQPEISAIKFVTDEEDTLGKYDYIAILKSPNMPDHQQIGIDLSGNVRKMSKKEDREAHDAQKIVDNMLRDMHRKTPRKRTSKITQRTCITEDRLLTPAICGAIVHGIAYDFRRPIDPKNPLISKQAILQYIENFKKAMIRMMEKQTMPNIPSKSLPFDKTVIERISLSALQKTISRELLRFSAHSISSSAN